MCGWVTAACRDYERVIWALQPALPRMLTRPAPIDYRGDPPVLPANQSSLAATHTAAS